MGVYIKGMEMPTSCEKCPFFDYEEGFCFASGVKGESGWYESTLCPSGIKGGRHDECPLVPVPPHGRLIDADAFEEFVRKDWDRNDHWIADVVYSRPTIIEAEGVGGRP